MKSILEAMEIIRSLEPVSNHDIYIRHFTETWKGVDIKKVAIYLKGYEKEIDLAVCGAYAEHCIVLYESHFNTFLKPIFSQITELNNKVREIKSKI